MSASSHANAVGIQQIVLPPRGQETQATSRGTTSFLRFWVGAIFPKRGIWRTCMKRAASNEEMGKGLLIGRAMVAVSGADTVSELVCQG